MRWGWGSFHLKKKTNKNNNFLQILAQAAKHMAQCESLMDNTATNLHKIELIRQHIGYQREAIQDSVGQLEYLDEQISAMER